MPDGSAVHSERTVLSPMADRRTDFPNPRVLSRPAGHDSAAPTRLRAVHSMLSARPVPCLTGQWVTGRRWIGGRPAGAFCSTVQRSVLRMERRYGDHDPNPGQGGYERHASRLSVPFAQRAQAAAEEEHILI